MLRRYKIYSTVLVFISICLSLTGRLSAQSAVASNNDTLRAQPPIKLLSKNKDIFFSLADTSGTNKFKVDFPVKGRYFVNMTSMSGKPIQTLEVWVNKPDTYYCLWNGNNKEGDKVSQGNYVIKVMSAKHYQKILTIFTD